MSERLRDVIGIPSSSEGRNPPCENSTNPLTIQRIYSSVGIIDSQPKIFIKCSERPDSTRVAAMFSEVP